MGGGAFVSDGGQAAPASIILARGFDHGGLIAPDLFTEPRSLM
jgi:hypothetical protein